MHNIALMPSIDCALSLRIQEITMIHVMPDNLPSSVMLNNPKSLCTVASDSWGVASGSFGCLITPCKDAFPATSNRENLPWGSALRPKKLILEGVPRGAKVQFCTPAPFVLALGGCLLLSVVVCRGARPCCLSSISLLKLLCVAVCCCRAFLC